MSPVAHLGILCLTIAHAYRLEVSINLPEAFESLVVTALQQRVSPAVGMAHLRRQHGSFKSALKVARKTLQLRDTYDETVLSHSAHDAKADVLAHLHWGDARRLGHWLVLGQVTIAKSDDWSLKIKEPTGQTWQALGATKLPPIIFLAIPHHVEELHLQELLQTERMVVHRLRLVPWLSSPSAELKKVIRVVRDVEIEFD